MNIAREFRTNHGNDLQPELITELLRSLNKIWRDREKKQILRIKQKCWEEVKSSKRFGNNKIGYEVIQLK